MSTDTSEAAEGQQAGSPGAHRHRTVRHVATHGGTATAVTIGAAAFHAFGVAGLAATLGAGAVAVGGKTALGRAGKGRRGGASRPAAIVRRRSRRETASRRITAAGLRRDSGQRLNRSQRAGAQASQSQRRAGSVSRPRTGAGLRRGQRADRTRETRAGRRVSTTRRRARPATVAPSTTRRAKAAAARPGRGTPSTRSARTAATRTRSRRASATRPAARGSAPAMRTQRKPATTSRSTGSVRSRRIARVARRHAIRSAKFIAAGARASRPYLRLRPPADPGKVQAPRAAAKKTTPANKTAPKPAATKKAAAPKPAGQPANATATRKTAGKPAIPTQRPEILPGRAITAPGQKRASMTDTHIPAGGITAVIDAIDEHIGGAEFDNAVAIFGFLAGLEPMCSHLGIALGNVADRLGSEYPLDQAVVGHLQEMAALAVNLGAWGEQANSIARAAHEGELRRIEDPRPGEPVFDVERNR